MTILFRVSFFLHFSLCFLYLHSFPTRRSSDLYCQKSFRPSKFQPRQTVCSEADCQRQRRTGYHKEKIRSEEHTSELQSPDHLVCRLLLEKKKQKISHIAVLLSCACHSVYP